MNPKSVIDVLESQSIGVNVVKYVASGYALAAIGARAMSGGAETGFELLSRLLVSVGFTSFAQWIMKVGVPTVQSWPHASVQSVLGIVIMALVFVLARRLQWSTYDIAPQPAFGVLLAIVVAVDTSVMSRGHIFALGVAAVVVGLLVGRLSVDGTWIDGMRVAMTVLLAPIAAILYIPLAVVAWLTNSGEATSSRVHIASLPDVVRVQLVNDGDRQPKGARRL